MIEKLSDSFRRSLGKHIGAARGFPKEDGLALARKASDIDLIGAMAVEYATSHIQVNPGQIDQSLLKKFESTSMINHKFVPIYLQQNILFCATTHPQDAIIGDLVSKVGLECKPILVNESNMTQILDALGLKNTNYSDSARQVASTSLVEGGERQGIIDLEAVGGETNAWRVCADLFMQCADQGVTDLHLQPTDVGDYQVRIESNGQLYNYGEVIPYKLARTMEFAIYNQTQTMRPDARMGPQDGNITFSYRGRPFDLRLATAPVYIGNGSESPAHFTIRFQDSNRNSKVTLESLGFEADILQQLTKAISTPGSFNVFSGPVGQGKTTTLGACLKFLNKEDAMIYAVEDPVENYYKGVNHIQVNRKQGVTFASVLKILLRKKPHVIMLAEVRDKETGELAMEAAMTGHTVLTTVHADFAYEVPARLFFAGITSMQASNKLGLCSSQRLLSLLCRHCAIERKTTIEDCHESGFSPDEYTDRVMAFHNPKGCSKCKYGYESRRPLLELISMDAAFRRLIEAGSSTQTLEEDAKDRLKMKTILSSAIELLLSKQTDMQAIQKIVKV